MCHGMRHRHLGASPHLEACTMATLTMGRHSDHKTFAPQPGLALLDLSYLRIGLWRRSRLVLGSWISSGYTQPQLRHIARRSTVKESALSSSPTHVNVLKKTHVALCRRILLSSQFLLCEHDMWVHLEQRSGWYPVDVARTRSASAFGIRSLCSPTGDAGDAGHRAAKCAKADLQGVEGPPGRGKSFLVVLVES